MAYHEVARGWAVGGNVGGLYRGCLRVGGEAEVIMASFVSLLVNDEHWEVRRGYYHRRPGRTMWLPGIPPEANIVEHTSDWT